MLLLISYNGSCHGPVSEARYRSHAQEKSTAACLKFGVASYKAQRPPPHQARYMLRTSPAPKPVPHPGHLRWRVSIFFFTQWLQNTWKHFVMSVSLRWQPHTLQFSTCSQKQYWGSSRRLATPPSTNHPHIHSHRHTTPNHHCCHCHSKTGAAVFRTACISNLVK